MGGARYSRQLLIHPRRYLGLLDWLPMGCHTTEQIREPNTLPITLVSFLASRTEFAVLYTYLVSDKRPNQKRNCRENSRSPFFPPPSSRAAKSTAATPTSPSPAKRPPPPLRAGRGWRRRRRRRQRLPTRVRRGRAAQGRAAGASRGVGRCPASSTVTSASPASWSPTWRWVT